VVNQNLDWYFAEISKLEELSLIESDESSTLISMLPKSQ